ncbi:MAG: hypothetical protein NVS3B2_12060 [Ramlibacter sp.]
MSLITRCPVCGTMFKVVPDQLRISEGWVRCGQCAEIFDAAASLQGPEEAAACASVPGPQPPLARQQVATASAVVVEAAPLAPAPQEGPESIDPPPLYPSFPSEVHESELERESRRDDEEPDLDSVSFVRSARRRAVWGRPVVRALLVFLALVLAGLLALQYAVQERDRLAAMQPALRPWLQSLCGALRCEIGPPRQIDAIVIDSSSFSRLRGDAYRLGFSLRNQAVVQVAMPSLELTLTDSQDQPVIRKVLAPRDFGSAAAIAAAGEASSSVALAVPAIPGSGRIAGYRLLAFYP